MWRGGEAAAVVLTVWLYLFGLPENSYSKWVSLPLISNCHRGRWYDLAPFLLSRGSHIAWSCLSGTNGVSSAYQGRKADGCTRSTQQISLDTAFPNHCTQVPATETCQSNYSMRGKTKSLDKGTSPLRSVTCRDCRSLWFMCPGVPSCHWTSLYTLNVSLITLHIQLLFSTWDVAVILKDCLKGCSDFLETFSIFTGAGEIVDKM